MKVRNILGCAAVMLITSCGSESPLNNEAPVKVDNADLPKVVVLVEDVATNEVKAYEADENQIAGLTLNEEMSDAQKYEMSQIRYGREIGTDKEAVGFKINMEESLDLPQKNSVSYYGGYYRGGFYGYAAGYRYPYSYGYGYAYAGYRYGYYRPYYGYGYGYSYGYRYGYYW